MKNQMRRVADTHINMAQVLAIAIGLAAITFALNIAP